MEAHEYQTLFKFETFYWWFKGLHKILLDTFCQLNLPDNALVLDAGCGTGQNLLNLTEHISPHSYGFDFSPEAARFWQKRGLKNVCIASINDIPFSDEYFDVVVSVDVLECDAVNQERALREMWRILKPKGYMILVVPAYKWLLTPEHHRAVGAGRRYSRKELKGLLKTQPIELIRITHAFALLFPAIAAYRLGKRFIGRSSDALPRSELRELPQFLNSFLVQLVNLESRFLRNHDLPFGSSILVVARKVGD